MLAVLCDEPFDDKDYYVEPKIDGVRAIAVVEQSGITLFSRTAKPIVSFPELQFDTRGHYCILDGEIYCPGTDGAPDIQRIQSRVHRKVCIDDYSNKFPAKMLVFDILSLDGMPFTSVPYIERKYALSTIIEPTPSVDTIPFTSGEGAVRDYNEYCNLGYEGIVMKRAQSIYRAGQRHRDWLKIKKRLSKIVYVVGYTQGTGKRSDTFGSLVCAHKVGNSYVFCGEVGTGFDDETLYLLKERMQNRCDVNIIGYCGPVTTCEPYRINVLYMELTKAGMLRHGVFNGVI